MAYVFPFTLIRCFRDRFRVRSNGCAYPDTLGQSQNTLTDLLKKKDSQSRYLDWPPYVTARATALGVDTTPTVLVEGAAVRPDTRTITAAVAAAHRAQ